MPDPEEVLNKLAPIRMAAEHALQLAGEGEEHFIAIKFAECLDSVGQWVRLMTNLPE